MRTVTLISCVSKKFEHPAKARDIYMRSPWFRHARKYAEINSDAWYILSAKHGLLLPEKMIDPYDKSLFDKPKREREAWAECVINDLIQHESGIETKYNILAGKRYREFLVPWVYNTHRDYFIPMVGLGIGEQLAWLKKQTQQQLEIS